MNLSPPNWLQNTDHFTEALRVPELDIRSQVCKKANLSVVGQESLTQDSDGEIAPDAKHELCEVAHNDFAGDV
jgi:hypothetical protein